MAPMAVHCVSRLNSVEYDKEVTLDPLFQRNMPMSSLKVLLKFMFRTQAINITRIVELFKKSSFDAKACMLEHFYNRSIDEPSQRPQFLQVLKTIVLDNQGVFINFFDIVCFADEQQEYKKEILDSIQ